MFCQICFPNVKIVEVGKEVFSMYFIYKGSVTVNTEDGTELTVLPSGSFFGDYQVLFGLKSNFEFISHPDDETWLMTVPKDQFIEVCEEFPQFHAFLTQRALVRRNYFKLLALKQNKRKVKAVLDSQRDEMLNINEDSDIEDNDDFLFNQDLMALDHNEKSESFMENLQLSICFTISMFRMYVSEVGDLASSLTRRIVKHQQTTKDFFHIAKLVSDETKPRFILRDLETYIVSKECWPEDRKRQGWQETEAQAPRLRGRVRERVLVQIC